MKRPSTCDGIETDHRELYSRLVRTYVDTSDERILLEVSALGRALVNAQTPPDFIGELHHQALADLARSHPDLTLGQANELVTEPLMELLIAYGMDFRERLASKEQALQEKVAELRRANLAKRQFLANMSHEIRTPLNGVIGVSWLLSESRLTEEQREYVRIIMDSGEALRGIIDDILDYSKIEANQLVPERHPFVLRECVESALTVVASRAHNKGLTLGYTIDRDVPRTIVSDVTRVRQVLLNLLSNAVKFTNQGDITVAIGLADPHSGRPGSDVQLSFTVKDTGIGISRERLSTIFESFRQADESTTRKYGGTGLGLAICKQLATLMGGNMTVDSDIGRGSTFRFSITTRAVEAPAPVHERRLEPSLRDRPVLLVTDRPLYRQMLVAWAETWGVQTAVVASGDDALALGRACLVFQSVILDADVPGAERFVERRTAMGADWHEPLMPVIVLRGIGSDRLSQFGPPACQFLTTPLSMSSVWAALYEQGVTRRVEPVETWDGDTDELTIRSAAIALSGVKALEPGATPPVDPSCDSGLKVLVAEDNPINRKLAVATLRRLGYSSDTASTGLEAVQAVQKCRYDMVLMDIQMPVMNGIDATREIRAKLAESEQPMIVALTANVTSEDRPRFRDAGMDGYLGKPFKITELKEMLEAACQQRRKRSDCASKSARWRALPRRGRSKRSAISEEPDRDTEPQNVLRLADLRVQSR